MSESLQTTGGKNSSGRLTENTGQNYRYQISESPQTTVGKNI